MPILTRALLTRPELPPASIGLSRFPNVQILERRLTPAQLNSEPHEPYREVPFFFERALTTPCDALHARVESLLKQGETAIVINLAQLTAWDSTGLGGFSRINPPARFREWVAALKLL